MVAVNYIVAQTGSSPTECSVHVRMSVNKQTVINSYTVFTMLNLVL